MPVQVSHDPFDKADREKIDKLHALIGNGPKTEQPPQPVVRPRPLIGDDEAKTIILLLLRGDMQEMAELNIARVTNLEPQLVRRLLQSMRGIDVAKRGRLLWQALPPGYATAETKRGEIKQKLLATLRASPRAMSAAELGKAVGLKTKQAGNCLVNNRSEFLRVGPGQWRAREA